MLDDDDSPLFEPLQLNLAEVKGVHVPIHDIHAVLGALYVPRLIDFYLQGYLPTTLYHLHEPVHIGTWVLILFHLVFITSITSAPNTSVPGHPAITG